MPSNIALNRTYAVKLPELLRHLAANKAFARLKAELRGRR